MLLVLLVRGLLDAELLGQLAAQPLVLRYTACLHRCILRDAAGHGLLSLLSLCVALAACRAELVLATMAQASW